MEADIEPTIDLVTYVDDGNLLLALGCLTYQAAHFERVIDDLLKDLAKLNPTRPEGKAPYGIVAKLNRCMDWLSKCYADRLGLEAQLEVFQVFKRLVARRNEAVHGALYQDIGGPVMRYPTTYAKDHAVTSSASLYELATELNLAGAAVATGAWIFVHDNNSPAIDASIHTGVIDD